MTAKDRVHADRNRLPEVARTDLSPCFTCRGRYPQVTEEVFSFP